MSPRRVDFVVVGAGLFGAVFAQRAKEAGRRVLVIERRGHVGGNCYSERDPDTGVVVHRYGTHVFHTGNREVWDYVRRFSEFRPCEHRVRTVHRGRAYPMPINLETINSFFGLDLGPEEAAEFLASRCEPVEAPANLEEMAIARVGRELYEAFLRGYTRKQWGADPRSLPASILARIPVRTCTRDTYFDDAYQGVPIGGYTPLFERLLEGVEVHLGTDYFADPGYWQRRAATLVYTGPLDRFFGFCHGTLGWRSLRFERELVPVEDYQGAAVRNFADEEIPYTRIHEPKHLHPEGEIRSAGTAIFREFPLRDDDEPYYPVGTPEDRRRLESYRRLQQAEPRVLFGGRLAEYRYLDMHQVVDSALKAARGLL